MCFTIEVTICTGYGRRGMKIDILVAGAGLVGSVVVEYPYPIDLDAGNKLYGSSFGEEE